MKSTPLLLVGLALALGTSCRQQATPPAAFEAVAPGLAYAHQTVPGVPWSIHVVRVDRSHPGLSLRSIHAQGGALGLETLSAQLQRISPEAGTPVAAVNGDFYQRDRAYMGDPRGCQVVDGEVVSAPSGGVSFWVDAQGAPQATNVTTHFEVAWDGGPTLPLGLNEDRAARAAVLYTPAAGASTHTLGGRELVLGPDGPGPWLPLGLNQRRTGVVVSVREAGDTPLTPGNVVVSLGPTLAKATPAPALGTRVQLSTATLPALGTPRTVLGGGPMLVRDGRVLDLPRPTSDSYEFNSMQERHPRSAVGWNAQYLYLVEVDGRQPGLSVGMTLQELGRHLAGLGCEAAMNLDGGGSATLWLDGRVRNRPCDGHERPIANALVVVRTPDAPARPSR